MSFDPQHEPGSEPSAGTSEILQQYENEGYVILRGVFDRAEVAELASDVERVLREAPERIHAHNLRVRFKPHHSTGDSLFEVFDPFADLSPVARAVTGDRRILDVLGALYGEPARLFKDKLIYKPPGAEGASLHQDWISWRGFPTSFLTVLVAIDPFTQASGATEVFPREHRRGYLSVRDGQHHQLEAKEFSSRPVPLLLEPGDLAIFSCFTPHRSGPNVSDVPRRGYFISYNAASDGDDPYEAHYREFHQWIRARAAEDRRDLLYFQ